MGNLFKITGVIVIFIITSCNDSYLGVKQIVLDKDAPDKLTAKEVVPQQGALEIFFTLPKGTPDISQVVATYKNKRGEDVEFKVSRYSSSIVVEGFTGTDTKTVVLKCIDASGNSSDTIQVTGAPLLSPVEVAMKTMHVEPAFGGVKVEWENKDAQPFAIHVLTLDTLQVGMATLTEDPSKTIYNQDSLNTFAYIRQYPAILQQFGFVISDKWGNRTDTLIKSLVPFKEEELDFNLIKEVPFFNPTFFAGRRDWDIWGIDPATGIQNDGNAHSSAHNGPLMFDGKRTGSQMLIYKFVKNLSDPDPANQITINDVYTTYDLHVDVVLSRVKIYPRNTSSYTYNRSSPKRFRIWGTDDSNNNRWSRFPEGWTLIGEYAGREPGDVLNLTQEEVDWFNLDQEYSVSEDNVNPEARPTTSLRYMRLQLMESYNKNESFYTIEELQMFGDISKYY